MNQFIYRLARPEDLSDLMQASVGNDGVTLDADLLPQLVENSKVYCAVSVDEIIALTYWQEDFLLRKDIWFLSQVTTKPFWRKKSVAFGLLKSFFDYAHGFGVKKIYFDIHPDNQPSLNLFKKIGAIESGSINGFDDEVLEDSRVIFRVNV